MTKMTNMILTAILRRGILYEAKNVNVDFEVPVEALEGDGKSKQENMLIHFKADNMTLQIEKGRGGEA
jgi:hypothetical protein